MDNDIEKYCRLVSSANSFIEESKEETNKKIEEKISEVYPDGRENEDSDKMQKQIRDWIRLYLLEAYRAENIDKFSEIFDPNLGATGFTDEEKEVIKAVLKDSEVIEMVAELKKKSSELSSIVNDIGIKTSSIVIAIDSKDYDTDAECCPTYWSIIKRFL